MLTVPVLHVDGSLLVPVGPRVGAGPVAPLREGHVPRLLLQEGTVEETENAELGQRGGLGCMQQQYIHATHTFDLFCELQTLFPIPKA